jgi:hypothetical protein
MSNQRLLISHAYLLLVLLGAGAACSGDDITVPPTTASIEVTTATTGPEPDPDGYTVQLDGGPAQNIGVSGSVNHTDIEPGNHTVQLAGLAANCTVAEENPRAITVAAGETATVAFVVTCGATTGGLQVASSTSGPSTDPDGYTLTVDGTERGTLGGGGNLTLEGLSPGEHVIGLSGVAANCRVEGDNPRTVTIGAGENPVATFAVTCAAPPGNAGTLRVTTATTGAGADRDGYSFTVDDGESQPIAVNATASLANVAAGPHQVRLSGIASNCALTGANPRSVTVTAGGSGDVGFALSCTANTGTVEVSVTTNGPQPDPDGYLVKLDDASPGLTLGNNGSVTFTDVGPVGDHFVVLAGVASNCSVKDGASHEVRVVAGATAEASFEVTCGATGTIRVSAPTSGESLDIDGYGVQLDREVSRVIAMNGTLTFSSVLPGAHTLTFFGVADNCQVQGETVRTVNVSVGTTAEVEFAVVCSATANGTWTARAPLPSARWGHTSAVVPDASATTIMYSFGGVSESPEVLRRVDAYNPASDSWSRRADMPGPRYLASAAALAGKIYVLGGRNSPIVSGGQTDNLMGTVLAYSPSTDTWSNEATLPRPADGLVSTAIGSHLYVLFGDPAPGGPGGLYHLYRYDPGTGSWERKADAPHSHFGGTGTVIDGRWYVIGGGDGYNSWGVYLDVYDPSTDTWSTKSTPPSGACSITPCHPDGDPFNEYGLAGNIGGKLYFASTIATEVYDPTTDTWSPRTKPRLTRYQTSGELVTRGGKQVMLVTGGEMSGQDASGNPRQDVLEVNEEFSE